MAANDDFSLLDDELSPSQAQARPSSRGRHGASTLKHQTEPETEKAREQALREELTSVRKVNEAIEGVVESLQKAQTNMKTVNSTVSAASQLLNTWTRILSQTEHNQRLMLDPSWQGASQDITDIEDEAQAKQYETERREIEEQERKAAAATKAEEDERRRAEAATRASKTTTTTTTATRGRGRGVSRGASTVSNTSTPASGSANTSILRAPSTSSRRGTTSIGRARGVRGKT